MNFDLDQEHELVRSTVREFAQQRVAPVAEELDRESRFPYELVGELGELGLMGMTIPEEYGGAGADTVSYAIAVEELTRVDSSVAITLAAHHSLGTLPIFYFGSEEQRQRWLPDLASGKQLAAFGLTEPDFGSNPAGMRTTAVRDGDTWVLNGEKTWITNGSLADVAVVWARAEDGIRGFLVEKGTPGFTSSEIHGKLSMQTFFVVGSTLRLST